MSTTVIALGLPAVTSKEQEVSIFQSDPKGKTRTGFGGSLDSIYNSALTKRPGHKCGTLAACPEPLCEVGASEDLKCLLDTPLRLDILLWGPFSPHCQGSGNPLPLGQSHLHWAQVWSPMTELSRGQISPGGHLGTQPVTHPSGL